MLILEDLSAEVPDTNAHHWNLKEYSQADNTHTVLMYGYNSAGNVSQQNQCEAFDRKIFFNNWAPCEFSQYRVHNKKTATEYDAYFSEIYSICPYTSVWLNTMDLGRIYKPIFYPFHKKLIPPLQDKIYDVIYHGGIHGLEHLQCLMVMRNFNYRYVTMTHHINQTTQASLPYATDLNLTFQDKINLVAKTKISICYNIVHISPQHIPAIKSYERWEDNEALCEVDHWNVKPQFKTRMHEAAISKTLNLVQRDPWNIAERYYEPNKEFLYFSDERELESLIKEILSDWESYQPMIDRAYHKAMNYTTDKFVEKIRNDK
mgnify:CR=1 FL=1|jgi:hypothetical protein|tara:strand:- start:10390 stop:11343 length:954 start_codon:yes stop_codon:yes gene_type:complete